jgi:hypothetical protein
VEPAQPVDAPVPVANPVPADPPAAADPPAHPAAVPASKRSERSPRDMALSLVVLLVPIALLLGFYRLVLNGDQPVAVDPAPAIAEARTVAAFPVLVPVGLAADWRVSTATFRRTADGATLRIGYVDPKDDPVQLLQSSVPFDTLIPAELGSAAAPGGVVRTGERTWQRYDARPGEAALVLSEKGRTVIVVGATEPGQLQTLAAALS